MDMVALVASTVKCDTKGLEALLKRLQGIDGTEVEVGFFEEDRYGPENNNLPVALVAYLNEYGHSIGPQGVPERPFMHETFGGRMEQFHMARAVRNIGMAVFSDGRSVTRLLNQLGEMIKDQLQVAIEDYPGDNSPTTIKRKGKNDPLRDTDKMLNSVKFKINR
jgi:hypothetical protein